LKNFPTSNIIVLAQNYQPSDFVGYARIKYVVPPGNARRTAAQARNILLEDFYPSDEDFTLFCDNDAMLYEHGNPIKSLTEGTLRNCWRAGVGAWCPIDPRNTPFSAMHAREKETLDKELVFKATLLSFRTAFFFLSNVRKFFNKKPYFSENVAVLDDGHFSTQLSNAGIGAYICQNFVLKDLGAKIPTLHGDAGLPDDVRKKHIERDQDLIYREFYSSGLRRSPAGRLDAQGFLKAHGVRRNINVKKEVV
jgi:hypothetical protein